MIVWLCGYTAVTVVTGVTINKVGDVLILFFFFHFVNDSRLIPVAVRSKA